MTEPLSSASRDQLRAARPDRSTWLSANAGSGKTRVLTDRVARLLLDEVPPERILCLTYTKAAAMEMQNRLFQRLGAWAMGDDAALRAALVQVGVAEEGLSAEVLARARTLFARAIEAPGGLKIQTIHSFCNAVLRRFPLEAGVTPGFTEIDERVQARLIADVLEDMAGDEGDGGAAIAAVVPFLSDEDGLIGLARATAGARAALAQPWTWEAICDWIGVAPDLTEAGVLATVLTGGERALCDAIWPRLNAENRMQKKPRRILRDMPWEEMTLADLAALEEVCLYGEGAAAPFAAKTDKPWFSKAFSDSIADHLPAMHALMERVEAARPLRLGLISAQKTHALHRFAAAFLPAFTAAKAARGWLDFDDQIQRMRALLNAPGVAQWVLFRLDGGIDHILVDEAQDTSPAQWDIVRRLTEDFAAGQGARADTARTIFVVGDKKQSIYSFQGADPAGFDRMADHFADQLSGIGQSLQRAELVWSFRSSPVILDLVDRIGGGPAAAGIGAGVVHRAFFDARPGRVDLLPVVQSAERAEDPPWDQPITLVGEAHHTTIMARNLATHLGALLAEGPEIEVGKTRRPVEAGDILILVQRRSALFRAIIAALKEAGLPVAGVDRADLTTPIAVKDMIALMKFLARPEDDLSLAALLRSPLCGWSEARLYALAQPREGYLWRALQTRREMDEDTVSMLEDLRDWTDFLRPYDLLERLLTRHDGRRRLIARLGPEAEDAIDAMLDQALAYERTEVPTLAGFVGWLESDSVTVKRDLSQARGMIRVMTAHGAKGLEAPVVVLPDCGQRKGRPPGMKVLAPGDGPALWPPARASAADPVRAALEADAAREEEERHRLLYVSLTRAESWLIIGAAGDVGRDAAGSWYNLVEAAMREAGAVSREFAGFDAAGAGLRLERGAFPVRGGAAAADAPRAALPEWALSPAPPAPRDRAVRRPSDLGGPKALEGEPVATAPDGAEADAMRRGRYLHLLLEHLPALPPAAWPAAAPGILALEGTAPPDAQAADLLGEATEVLVAPDLAPLFAPEAGALAEVALCGESAVLGAPILGAIDRLLVEEDRVLALDYKSNRLIPAAPDAVPEGLLRQMGAYAEQLAALYPDRRIETAILWTRAPRLMVLPHDLVMAALARAAAS